MIGKKEYAQINALLNRKLEEKKHMIAVHRGSYTGNITQNTIPAYIAAIRMGADMVEGDINKVSGRTAFNAAKQGDKAGKEVVDMYINYLAYGMVNIVNIFQPQVFAIGGGVCGEGDYLLKPLTEIARSQEYGSATRTQFTEIKIAELGNDAGIIGAALLGI